MGFVEIQFRADFTLGVSLFRGKAILELLDLLW